MLAFSGTCEAIPTRFGTLVIFSRVGKCRGPGNNYLKSRVRREQIAGYSHGGYGWVLLDLTDALVLIYICSSDYVTSMWTDGNLRVDIDIYSGPQLSRQKK